MHYTIAEEKLAELLRLEEERIPTLHVYDWYGYLLHRGCGCVGSQGLRYHTYLLPAGYNLKDAVPFAYGANFVVRKTAAACSEKRRKVAECRRNK